MSAGRLPDDPFRGFGRGRAFDDLAEASTLWALLGEMSAEEAGRAVRALDADTLRNLVLERLLFGGGFGRRLQRDGTIAFDRPDEEAGG